MRGCGWGGGRAEILAVQKPTLGNDSVGCDQITLTQLPDSSSPIWPLFSICDLDTVDGAFLFEAISRVHARQPLGVNDPFSGSHRVPGRQGRAFW